MGAYKGVRGEPWSAKYVADGECRLWQRATTPAGYGVLRVEGRIVLAHRHAYEVANGSIPEGLTIDHICRRPACVNPAHLEAVPIRTNILRGVGFAAVNAAKTHCLYGHEYTAANTYTRPSRPRERECLTCLTRRNQLRYA